MSADSLEVSKSSDGLEYRFERSEIDHLYFGRMRLGRIPVPWFRCLHFFKRDGTRAPVFYRPYAHDRADTFDQLAAFGWEVGERYGD